MQRSTKIRRWQVGLMLGLLLVPGGYAKMDAPQARSSPGPVQLAVSDCPVHDVLRMLSSCLGCRLLVEPELNQRITLTASEGTVESMLARILPSFNYMVTWTRARDAEGRSIEKIESITVFKTGPGSPGLAKAPVLSSTLISAGADRRPQSTRLEDYLGQENKTSALVIQHAIGRTADAHTLTTIRDAYEKARTEAEREKIRALVRTITSKEAEAGLMAMAGPVNRVSDDPMQEAALLALANLGTGSATDHLLERLEKADAKEAERVAEVLQNVTAAPPSVEALRRAASGSKRFPSETVRVAAVRSLGRFQDLRTMELLNQLTKDSNKTIRAAASDVLKEMEEEE